MIALSIFKVVSIGIALALVLLGLVSTIRYFLYKKAFNSWPAIAAEITHSEFKDNTQFINGTIKRAYLADIKISYRFRGKDYISGNPILSNHRFFRQYSKASELVNKYKKGDIVTIKVNEVFPDEGFIEVAPLDIIAAVVIPIGSILYLALTLLIVQHLYNIWS